MPRSGTLEETSMCKVLFSSSLKDLQSLQDFPCWYLNQNDSVYAYIKYTYLQHSVTSSSVLTKDFRTAAHVWTYCIERLSVRPHVLHIETAYSPHTGHLRSSRWIMYVIMYVNYVKPNSLSPQNLISEYQAVLKNICHWVYSPPRSLQLHPSVLREPSSRLFSGFGLKVWTDVCHQGPNSERKKSLQAGHSP